MSILKLCIAVRAYYKNNVQIASIFDESITNLIEKSEVDLQIGYSQGQFYPSKEKLLDKELIDYALNILNTYPDEDKDLRIALQNYNSNNKYGIIEYCYRCMEGLTRKILNNKKTLIDNKTEILKKISVSDNWKRILSNYIEFGNEYGRHASTNRHQLTGKEAEGYLYMTGVLIRLILSGER